MREVVSLRDGPGSWLGTDKEAWMAWDSENAEARKACEPWYTVAQFRKEQFLFWLGQWDMEWKIQRMRARDLAIGQMWVKHVE